MKNNSHWLWCFGGGFGSGRKEENETLDSSGGGSFGGRVPAGGGCGKEAPEAGSSSEGHVHIVTHANWNPFEYLKDGKITGFDIDLIEEASKRAGLTPDITDAGWEAIFEQIRTGQADAAVSGITITDDRKKTYLFPNLILCPGRRFWCGRILIFPVRRI